MKFKKHNISKTKYNVNRKIVKYTTFIMPLFIFTLIIFTFIFKKEKKTFITIELTNLDLEFIVDGWGRVFGV